MKNILRTNEVRIVDTDSRLNPTYGALEWLRDNNHQVDKDWDLDMHGGELGYTSFFFADHRLAIQFKMIFS